MSRRSWMAITLLAAGLLLVAGNPPGAPAVAQALGDGQAEMVDRLMSDGLSRAEMVSLYESLGQGEFEPPACVSGDEMFTDVPASHPFCAWIEELARQGITEGCSTTEYCPNDPVTRSQMAIFILRATADEPFRLVGEEGEPEFGNGGDGDCLWQNDASLPLEVGPVAFYQDSDGIVRLTGSARAVNGPGDDMSCDNEPNMSDAVIFELPAGYQPEHVQLFPVTSFEFGSSPVEAILIAPEGGLILGEALIPGGAVIASSSGDGASVTLGGIAFRAATETTTSGAAPEPANLSLRDLFD